jgi:acetylornithine deacetylase/succinyl-diaminopimelate desuccinylase-like protein
MNAAMVYRELQELLGGEAEVVFRSELLASLLDESSELIRVAKQVLMDVRGEATITKFSACTEASFFSVGCGIPTIILGPGNIAQAHKIDEYVLLSQIKDAVSIYTGIGRHYSKDKIIE